MGKLSHLDALEAEAIYIIREVAAECEKPVMLYSIGKDSTVMMHLALKAFYPEKPPFPFLHINTTWKFHEMIAFRDRRAAETGMNAGAAGIGKEVEEIFAFAHLAKHTPRDAVVEEQTGVEVIGQVDPQTSVILLHLDKIALFGHFLVLVFAFLPFTGFQHQLIRRDT